RHVRGGGGGREPRLGPLLPAVLQDHAAPADARRAEGLGELGGRGARRRPPEDREGAASPLVADRRRRPALRRPPEPPLAMGPEPRGGRRGTAPAAVPADPGSGDLRPPHV